MNNTLKKSASVFLCFVLAITALFPTVAADAATAQITIYHNGAELAETLHITEYASENLTIESTGEIPADSHIEWSSDMPLLANVDDNGKVTAYDYSKAAVIRYWLDNEVRPMPIIGESLAQSIEKAFSDAGIDLNDDNLNTDLVVAIVKGINPTLGTALENLLNNMSITITARLVAADGSEISKDTASVVVDKSFAGNIWPTGVHITNKKVVPKVVAVGKQVQLFGAVTPVRLKQGVKWTVGKLLDNESSKHATISDTGLVTFTSPGTVTIRVNPENTLYAAVSDTVDFVVVDRSELPVQNFDIDGNLNVKEGESTQLSLANVTPAGSYTGSVVWSSSDTSAAVVTSDGLVTALDAGSGLALSKDVQISAAIDGVTKTVTLKISKNIIGATLSGVSIDGYDNVGIGETNKYYANVTPDRLNSNKDVIREWGLYHSETGELITATPDAPANNGFASLDSQGNLTSSTAGIIKIHCKVSYNGTVFETDKEVSAGVPITSFTLTKGSGFTTNILVGTKEPFLEEGKRAVINISSITPEDFDQNLLENIVWTSSDPSIASVDSNGNVFGLDSGGLTIYHKKTVTITASVGGVSSSITFDVRGASLENLVNADIVGNDYVIKDFPRSYSAIFSPSRIDAKKVHWGLSNDNGSRPWESKWSSTEGNTENSLALVDAGSGMVYGKSAGTTNLWVFGREGLTSIDGSFAEASKEIKIIELQPKSITVTAPDKYDYLEGDTELDLTGLEVTANYNRDDIAQYYPDAESYGDSIIPVKVTDYEVGALEPAIIDKEQYIVVTLTRAEQQIRTVFPVKIHSKAVESIDIEAPRYQYTEGEVQLDLNGLHVYANYSNAPREEVFDYNVNVDGIDFSRLNEEQTVKIIYEHYGRTAEAEFKIIIYGKPVISIDTNGYSGEWTSSDVTFSFDSTHQINGITYYYKSDGGEWQAINGNSLTITENTEAKYYFKAVSGVGVESAPTAAYSVKIDKTNPSFTLTPEINEITNQSYSVQIADLVIGASGIKSIVMNGADITGSTSFTVNENGEYTVKITAGNGLEYEQTVKINNIDKEAPAVDEISVSHKATGGFARFINELTFGLFFNKTTDITITAQDTGIAGIDRIEYRFLDENGEPVNEWAVYDDTNKPTQEQNFKGYVEARAFDRANNVSNARLSTGYVIDTDKPTDIQITASAGGSAYSSGEWTADDVTITLSSDAFSGIYKYYYSKDGGEWIELNKNVLTISSQGVSSYRFKAVSFSANETETELNYIVKLDKTEPVVRVDFEGTFGRWSADGVTFTLSTMNEAISGITYYYSNDGGKTWNAEESGSRIVIDENVNASYIFKAVNGAGVESNPSDSYAVMIDTVAPSLEYTPLVTDSTAKPYDILFNVNTGDAGLKAVSVNGKDVTGSNSFTVTENGKYVVVMTGNNGVTSTEVITVNNIISPERPVFFVGVDGTLGQPTSSGVTFTLTSPNSADDITYYYNIGGEWIEMDGNTLEVKDEGNFTYKFKAVNTAGLESYESPEYNVIIQKERFNVNLKTTVLENMSDTTGTAPLSGVDVYVGDELIGTTDSNGEAACNLEQGEYTVTLDNGTFNRTVTLIVNGDCELNTPMVAVDADKNGCVNACDYAIILRDKKNKNAQLYASIFKNFINLSEENVAYV